VKVSSTRKNNRLHLTVADDGVGIKTDTMPTNGSRIGLSNIKQRLHYLYGDNHSFALSTFPNSGVKIEIEIPFETTDEKTV
jgi:LytS/YehU family sensor histidine kinase